MAALALETEPRVHMRRRGVAHKFFEGERRGATFRIRRIPGYTNGFLPQIHITGAPQSGGALMQVTMHPPLNGMAFLTLWGAPLLLAGIIFSQQGAPMASAFFPFGMMLFVAVLGLFLFNYEADKARRTLLEVFRGSLAPKAGPTESHWPNA
jgi:hypothetical protein